MIKHECLEILLSHLTFCLQILAILIYLLRLIRNKDLTSLLSYTTLYLIGNSNSERRATSDMQQAMTDTQLNSDAGPGQRSPAELRARQTRVRGISRSFQHYDIPCPDMAVIAAAINHQLANRNLLIPLLAKNLQSSDTDTDLHEIFLKTANDVRREVPAQVPEYRTTLRYKLCLKKVFKNSLRYESQITLSLMQKLRKLIFCQWFCVSSKKIL